MSVVRWGILGCGDVTEKKSGPAFRKVPGSELVAVMRRDEAKAGEYAVRHGVRKWYGDARKLIEDPEVDVVYIATPPGSHCDYALQVAAAGKPCYVEKPMARNAEECQRMVEAFQKKNLPLWVAYYRRALHRFVLARELIGSGEIGEIVAIEYAYADGQCRQRREPPPWRLVPRESGGGLFLDLGSHLLDALDYIFGPLGRVWGEAKNLAGTYPVEDYVVMNFTTPDGVRGVCNWDFASEERQDLLQILGTRGSVELSCFGSEVPVVIETVGGRREVPSPYPEHVQQPLIQQIVDQINGKGQCPSTGETAMRTQAVMDAVLQSYYGSRAGTFWEREAQWPGNPLAKRTRGK